MSSMIIRRKHKPAKRKIHPAKPAAPKKTAVHQRNSAERDDNCGVLLLSQFTGAAREMREDMIKLLDDLIDRIQFL